MNGMLHVNKKVVHKSGIEHPASSRGRSHLGIWIHNFDWTISNSGSGIFDAGYMIPKSGSNLSGLKRPIPIWGSGILSLKRPIPALRSMILQSGELNANCEGIAMNAAKAISIWVKGKLHFGDTPVKAGSAERSSDKGECSF